MIETEVIAYTPDSRKRAKRIEEIANAREAKGDVLVSALATPNCGVILVFRTPTYSERK